MKILITPFLIMLLCASCVFNYSLERKKRSRQNFQLSCQDFSFNGSTLKAVCFNASHQKRDTQVDLNKCITNNNGRLEWQSNGRAFFSSRSCYLSGTTLSCTSGAENGKWLPSSIDLKEKITNSDGALVCANDASSKQSTFSPDFLACTHFSFDGSRQRKKSVSL